MILFRLGIVSTVAERYSNVVEVYCDTPIPWWKNFEVQFRSFLLCSYTVLKLMLFSISERDICISLRKIDSNRIDRLVNPNRLDLQSLCLFELFQTQIGLRSIVQQSRVVEALGAVIRFDQRHALFVHFQRIRNSICVQINAGKQIESQFLEKRFMGVTLS